MNDFFRAALPWVLIGLAVAVFAAFRGARGKRSDGKKAKQGDCMTEGMCIGMCMGVALGSSGAVDLGTGISLGMLVGMCVGMFIKKENQE